MMDRDGIQQLQRLVYTYLTVCYTFGATLLPRLSSVERANDHGSIQA